MNSKKIISLFCLAVLVILGLHMFSKSNGEKQAVVATIIVIGLPPLIGLLVSILRRHLFYPIFWSATSMMLIFLLYLRMSSPTIENEFDKASSIAQNHFSKSSGFFTYFSPVVIYNQDVDSVGHSKDIIIKCIYQRGNQTAKNYFIGKVKIEKDVIVKEYYNQRIVDDTVFARREFGKTLDRIKIFNEFINQIDTIRSVTEFSN